MELILILALFIALAFALGYLGEVLDKRRDTKDSQRRYDSHDDEDGPFTAA